MNSRLIKSKCKKCGEEIIKEQKYEVYCFDCDNEMERKVIGDDYNKKINGLIKKYEL